MGALCERGPRLTRKHMKVAPPGREGWGRARESYILLLMLEPAGRGRACSVELLPPRALALRNSVAAASLAGGSPFFEWEQTGAVLV